MPIWCCTDCGCEALAASVDMVVSMRWLVELPTPGEESIAALCAQCRLFKKGPLRGPSRGGERPADGVAATRSPRKARGEPGTST